MQELSSDFFLSHTIIKTPNPHRIHPLSERAGLGEGLAASGLGVLCRATVFCAVSSRTLKVKTVLVQHFLVPACSLFNWSMVVISL